MILNKLLKFQRKAHIFKPIDKADIKAGSLFERKNKVSADDFAKPWKKGGGFKDFIGKLPNILAGDHLREVISSVVSAFSENKTVVFGLGAHVIKVGLSPVVIDLMERGVISAVALNGAGIIHDLELAMTGKTSEDVAESLENGTFGMAGETCAFLNDAVKEAKNKTYGLGLAVGRQILEKKPPFFKKSILATGARIGIPVTVHVAIGTDIIHMHPGFQAGNTGEASHRDFMMFTSVIATLEGGVYLNIGSAVILPEVFLKAVALARNTGHQLNKFTTVNMDFNRHYRPLTNVVERPTSKGGKG
ncbi:MAG: hypothetical protein ACE5DO_03260, partial [Desulfobacterales bacterium]